MIEYTEKQSESKKLPTGKKIQVSRGQSNDSLLQMASLLGNQGMRVYLEQPKESKPAATGEPIVDSLHEKFERKSGVLLDDVQVHYNSDKSQKLGAKTYAQSNENFIGLGNKKDLGHEIGHVVQQKKGLVRPAKVKNKCIINDDVDFEKEADERSFIRYHQSQHSSSSVPVAQMYGEVTAAFSNHSIGVKNYIDDFGAFKAVVLDIRKDFVKLGKLYEFNNEYVKDFVKMAIILNKTYNRFWKDKELTGEELIGEKLTGEELTEEKLTYEQLTVIESKLIDKMWNLYMKIPDYIKEYIGKVTMGNCGEVANFLFGVVDNGVKEGVVSDKDENRTELKNAIISAENNKIRLIRVYTNIGHTFTIIVYEGYVELIQAWQNYYDDLDWIAKEKTIFKKEEFIEKLEKLLKNKLIDSDSDLMELFMATTDSSKIDKDKRALINLENKDKELAITYVNHFDYEGSMEEYIGKLKSSTPGKLFRQQIQMNKEDLI